jgi:hypothetical protein
MKTIKYILSTVLLLAVVWSCTKVEDNFDFVSTVKAPVNISALYNITQDNTGLVTITPSGEGATSFAINFGDGTAELATLKMGESVNHTYAEGNYQVKIVGVGVTSLTTEVTQDLVVSFKAPENLVVVIENDQAVSKQVNVTANADFATLFDVYFGETVDETPVSANIGETASFVYQDAGTFTIRVVAKGGAIATTEYAEDFDVTAIVQPITSAPTPENRAAADVMSIYSSVYTDNAGTDYFPDWGQAGQGSGWAEFDLAGDKMLQYINLSYQGISFGETIDVSAMEYLHLDVWTADVSNLETFLINGVDGDSNENMVSMPLTADEWTSLDIPISAWTDQGLSVDQIFQLKFVGDPWAGGTVFIDNIYFYRAPSVPVKLPLTFDDDGQTFGTFNGASFAIDVDPDDANNPVGMITNSGAEWEGISLDLDEPVDLSVNKQIRVDFYSTTTGNTVLFKFENGTDNPVEVLQTIIQTGWSELVFDFSTANYSWPNSGAVDATGSYNSIVMFVDGGQWIPGTYYIDNITQVGASSGTDVTPITFETGFEMSSFDGGDMMLVGNPDATGNNSDMVLKLVKGDGQTWAGSKLTVPAAFSVSNTTVTAKVWSPRVGLNLLMKYEDAEAWPNTTSSAEIVATTTVANAWEELTFDFAGIDASIDYLNLVLIMDNGTVGDGGEDYTIYVDDISAHSDFDFEIGKAMSSFDGGEISVVTNPDATGNTSPMVAKLVKGAGQTWAGSKITTATPFVFGGTTVTVQVYSPRVGLELLMKFEDATAWPNTVATPEIKVITTAANQWEELTFDFAGLDATVDFLNLVLIMDNGTAGDGSADYTIYVDDIAQN